MLNHAPKFRRGRCQVNDDRSPRSSPNRVIGADGLSNIASVRRRIGVFMFSGTIKVRSETDARRERNGPAQASPAPRPFPCAVAAPPWLYGLHNPVENCSL